MDLIINLKVKLLIERYKIQFFKLMFFFSSNDFKRYLLSTEMLLINFCGDIYQRETPQH